MKKTYFSRVKQFARLCMLSVGMICSTSVFSQDVSTGLLLHYTFDNVTGTNVPDVSGTGTNGTLQGAVTLVDGYSGQGANCTLKDDYVSIPANINTDLTSFSFATWVNLSALKNATRFFDLGTGIDATNNFLAFIPSYNGDNGFMCLRYRPATGTAYNALSTAKIPTGKWAHVALTYQWDASAGTGTATIYLNGANVGTTTGLPYNPTMVGTTADNYLARSRWNQDLNGLNGAMDDVRFYNRALSVTDILTLTGLAELNTQTSALTLSGLSAVTSNITLPTTMGTNGVTVKWASSNNALIDTFGVVTRPQEYNAPVRLTATLSQVVGDKTYTMNKEFIATVIALKETPDRLAQWDFDGTTISVVDGVTKVTDKQSGFVGTCMNEARIRTIGLSEKFNVLDLGNGSGYFDMGKEIGKAIYSLGNYTMCGYFRIDDDYASLNSNGNFYWTFSNTDSAMTKQTGYIIGSLKNQTQSVSSNYYALGNQATGPNINAAKGGWHHIAYTQDGNTGTIFIDGVQVSQNAAMTNLPALTLPKDGLSGTIYNWLGRSNYVADAYLRKTMLYDFQLLNIALTPDDINFGEGFEVNSTIGRLNAAYAENPDYILPELTTEMNNLTFDKLSAQDSAQVTDNLNLPTAGLLDSNISISWSSNNVDIISATGTVTRPDFYPYGVTLTATLTKNGQKVTKTFHPTVLTKAGTEFTSDLLVKYDFAVTNGSIVTDAAEKHFTGTVMNDATIRTIGTAQTGTYNVLDLGNGTGYFDMGSEVGKVLYHQNDFTMSAYFRVDTAYADTELNKGGNFLWNFSNSDKAVTDKNGYVICSLKDQSVSISPSDYNAANGNQGLKLGTAALKGEWHNFTYTQSGTIGTIYIDGMPLVPGDITNLLSTTLPKAGRLGTLYNWIGRSCYASNGDVFLRKTLVYDFRLYRKALSDEQIQSTELNVGTVLGQLNAAYTANPNIPASVDLVKGADYKVISSVGSIKILGLNGDEKVSVYDITGRQFKVTNPAEIALKTGVYIVKVNGYITKVVVR